MEEVRAPLNQEVMEQKQRLINEVLRGEQRGEQRGPLRTSMQPAPAPSRQVEVWCEGKVIEWTSSTSAPNLYKGLPPLYQP